MVASLWRIQDEATVGFMKFFYENLLEEGLPYDEALRQAQLSMWRDPDRRFPYYWGAFVLSGIWH